MAKFQDLKSDFVKYISALALRKADLILFLAMLVVLFLCWKFYIPLPDALKNTVEIDLGYSAKQDANGDYYVVDSGHNRLICFDENSNLKHVIDDVSDGESSGLYIDDFAVSNGLTYISASEWNGMILAKEAVLVFDKDNYLRTIAAQDYSNKLVNKHRFHGITVENNILRYVEAGNSSIIIHTVDLETDEDLIERHGYYNAFNAISDCAFSGDVLYILDKSGIIISVDDGMIDRVYSTTWAGEKTRIPYDMDISPNEEIYFTDIRGREIVKVDSYAQKAETVFGDTDSLTVNLSDSGELLLVDEDGLEVVSDEVENFVTLKENSAQIAAKIFYLALAVILCVLLLLIACRVFVITKNNPPEPIKIIAGVMILVIFVVSAVTCKMQIDKFSETYRNEIMSKLENSAYILVNQIPGEILDEINNAEDFYGEAYTRLCRIMDNSFPMNVDINRQTYCNILRLDESGEHAYSIAYLDRSIGVYFPLLVPSEVEEIQRLYNSDGTLNHIWNLSVSDASGYYISLKVPIYESGECKGVVSLGTDATFIQEIIQEIAVSVLLSTIVILMLVWLGIAEVVAWFESKRGFEKAVADGKADALPSHFIRLLIFTIFICMNLTSTFLPVWIIRNSGEFQGAELEFMASLPFTVNIFVMGLMSLVAPALMKKMGIRRLLTTSSIAALCGNLLMFLIPGYYSVIFIGLILDGIGIGLVTNSTYVLLTYIQDEEDKQRGFNVYNIASLTGSNFGMMLGSVLAVILNQRVTFFIVALIWFSLMVMSNVILSQLTNLINASNAEEETQEAGSSLGQFLLNKPVLSFMVLIQNPYIMFNGFIFFFMPMFCENHGYSEIVVSMIMMLYSEAAVLSDNHLSERMTNFGSKSMYIAYFLNIAAILLFALTDNILGMILAMTLLGIAGGFGKPMQQMWFLKQKPVQKYGEDKAMGVYNFTENIGESLGPMIFSRIMSTEPIIASVSIFCSAVAATGFAHMALNEKELSEADKAD